MPERHEENFNLPGTIDKGFLKKEGNKSGNGMREINITGEGKHIPFNHTSHDDMMKFMAGNVSTASYSEIEAIVSIMTKKHNQQELDRDEEAKLYSFKGRLKSTLNSTTAGQDYLKGKYQSF
ncbi:MAG: hypothetical protein ABRQ39_21280 [Candidatus Eremiobacterota bacterium]